MISGPVVMLFVIGVPIIAGVTLLLLRRMPVKSTSFAVKLDVGVAWVAALSILLLVPLDIADTFYAYNNHGSYYPGPGLNHTQGCGGEDGYYRGRHAVLDSVAALAGEPERRDTRSQQVLSICWEIVYWYTFAAMMTILPFHQEFADSGAFTRWERTLWSLRQNLLFILVAGSIGAFGILILLASHRLTVDSLLGFVIATSNAFGLCLVLLLLGYGLVDLPRKIWRLAAAGSDEKESHMHQAIGLQAERTKKTHKEVCRMISIVREVSKYFGARDPLRKYMDIVEATVDLELEAELFSSHELVPSQENFSGAGCGYNFKLENEDLEFEYADVHQLGLLRRDVRKAQEGYKRERSRYIMLVKQGFASVYKIHVGKGGGHDPYDAAREEESFLLSQGEPAGPANAVTGIRNKATTGMRKISSKYNKYLAPTVLRIFSVFLYFLSTCIVLAQLTIYEGLPVWLKKVSPLKLFIGLMEPNLMLIQISCLALVGYILATCWFSMFKLKVFSIYVMVPKHTPSNSMLMNAMLLCRLAPPIAFNFMMIAMPMTQDDAVDVRQTTFYKEFGEKMLDLSSLGNFLGLASLSFTTFAPVVMLPYILFILFKKTRLVEQLSALCKCCKKNRLEERFEGYQFEEEEVDNDDSNFGQRLLEKELGYFQGGLSLGKALREALAEEAREQGRKQTGPFWKRKSPEPLIRPPRATAGAGPSQPNLKDKIRDRIKGWGIGSGARKASQPLTRWHKTYGRVGRNGDAPSSSSSTEEHQKKTKTEELDDIFRNL